MLEKTSQYVPEVPKPEIRYPTADGVSQALEIVANANIPKGFDLVYDRFLPGTDLQHDMIGTYRKEVSGINGQHIARGLLAKKFREMSLNDRYAPFVEDLEIIITNPGYYADIAEVGRRSEPLTLIEAGCGLASEKTENFLRIMQPDNYVAVDTSEEALTTTAEMVRAKFPQIKVFLRQADFYSDDITSSMSGKAIETLKENHGLTDKDFGNFANKEDLPSEGKRILIQVGQTLGNMCGFIDEDFPQDELERRMIHMSGYLRPGDYSVFGIAQKAPGIRIASSYSSVVHKKLHMGLLETVRDELFTRGFNPEIFEYCTRSRENGYFGIGWKITSGRDFSIADADLTVVKGEFYSNVNSYRIPPICFELGAQASGQRIVKIMRSSGLQMAHFVLQKN